MGPIRISEDAVYEVLDGEAVVLHLGTGRYYRLNAVASRAWQLLGEHGDVVRVRDALLAEFDVAADRLDADLAALIDDLAARGLLDGVGPR